MTKPAKRGHRLGRQRPTGPPVSSDEAHARAAEDITARLAQIARSGSSPQGSAARDPSREPESAAIELRGAQVVDCSLVSPEVEISSADVISINAYPDRERPESVVIRIDGWEGHLCMILPRDRAALLIKKLENAIDT